jgi:hypothetical protein
VMRSVLCRTPRPRCSWTSCRSMRLVGQVARGSTKSMKSTVWLLTVSACWVTTLRKSTDCTLLQPPIRSRARRQCYWLAVQLSTVAARLLPRSAA